MDISTTFNSHMHLLNISDCNSIARWPSPPCSNHGTCVTVNSSESFEEILACYCDPGFHAEGDSLFDIVVGYDGVYGDCDISSIEIKRLWVVSTALVLLGIVLFARVCLIKYRRMKQRSVYDFVRIRNNRITFFMLCSVICYFVAAAFKLYDAKLYAIGKSWGVTLFQMSGAFLLMTGQFEASVFLLESSTNPFLKKEYSSSRLQNAAEKLRGSLRGIVNQTYFVVVGNFSMGVPSVVMIFVPQFWEVLHATGMCFYMLFQIILQVQLVRHTKRMIQVLEFLKESQKDRPEHFKQFVEIQKCITRQNDESLVNISIQMILSVLFVAWPLLRHKMPYYNPIAMIVGLCFVCTGAYKEATSLLKRHKFSKIHDSANDTKPASNPTKEGSAHEQR